MIDNLLVFSHYLKESEKLTYQSNMTARSVKLSRQKLFIVLKSS